MKLPATSNCESDEDYDIFEDNQYQLAAKPHEEIQRDEIITNASLIRIYTSKPQEILESTMN